MGWETVGFYDDYNDEYGTIAPAYSSVRAVLGDEAYEAIQHQTKED